MENILPLVNNSKFLVGFAMLAMNLGSRFLITSFSAKQEEVFKSPVFKKVVLFCIFFVGTRDILIASMLWLASIFLLECVLNEKKRFSLFNYAWNIEKHNKLYEKYCESFHKNNPIIV